MKKRIIIGSIVVAVFALAVAVYQYQRRSKNTVDGDPAYTTTASELFKEFDANEDSANAKYLNKVILVRGEIVDMTPIDSANLNIVLGTTDPIFGVSCQLPAANQNKLKVGESVNVKGLCTGKLMDVVLVKCVIEKQNLRVSNK
jgi:hypothetical protein